MVSGTRDLYQAYYTKSVPILQYMVNNLSPNRGDLVLEPCAGDGVLIDAVLNKYPGVSIEAYELNSETASSLAKRYTNHPNVRVVWQDALTTRGFGSQQRTENAYDRVIGNPPYGGWLDYDKRAALKLLYPRMYVKETYGLFLYRSIKLLREGGKLVFIVPDTFLNLHRHAELRRFLLHNSKLQEIVLFPSSFFPGVSFGYAKLCIITLEKSSNTEECLDNIVRVRYRFRHVDELVSAKSTDGLHETLTISQRAIYGGVDQALFVADDPRVSQLINNAERRVSDIADCVTGFYSGNDARHLKYRSDVLTNVRRYKPVAPEQIAATVPPEYALEGIPGPRCFVPIKKGGPWKFHAPDAWYMEWSRAAVEGYRVSAKARFQNSSYYFRPGIGIPMVSSSGVRATLMEGQLFDQSIVGVFPKDARWTLYLLGLFNSPTGATLMRTINPSANNSANYVKKVPFLDPSRQQARDVESCVSEILGDLKRGDHYQVESELAAYEIIRGIYGF